MTHISEEGEEVAQGSSMTPIAKLCMIPIQPRTTSKTSSHCAYCHSNNKALGQYTEGIDTGSPGKAHFISFGEDS